MPHTESPESEAVQVASDGLLDGDGGDLLAEQVDAPLAQHHHRILGVS
jgi:hypothetical protein